MARRVIRAGGNPQNAPWTRTIVVAKLDGNRPFIGGVVGSTPESMMPTLMPWLVKPSFCAVQASYLPGGSQSQ